MGFGTMLHLYEIVRTCVKINFINKLVINEIVI